MSTSQCYRGKNFHLKSNRSETVSNSRWDLAIEISLTVPRRHREADRTNPERSNYTHRVGWRLQADWLRADSTWPVSWLEKIFFFLFGARAAGVCAVAARDRFKRSDPAEWPRSILEADRMPGQDDSRLWKPNDSARTDRTWPDDLVGVTNRSIEWEEKEQAGKGEKERGHGAKLDVLNNNIRGR